MQMQFDWAGLTACHQLIYDDIPGNMTSYFDRIANSGSALKWGLQINCYDEAKAIARVTEYINSAIGRAQAQTILVSGVTKYVISTFWHCSLPAASWTNLRNGVRTNTGKELYIIGDYGPWCSWAPYRSDWNTYKTTADSWYTFSNPVYATTFNDIANAMTAAGKPYAGGILASAGREDELNAADIDAQGTKTFRDWWQSSLDKTVKWQTVNTWNDTEEKHHIFPSSDWNWTRADLNYFYSCKLRSIDPASRFGNNGTLYVTTPRHLHLNESSVAEALVINSSNRTIIAKIQLLNNLGVLIGSPVQVNVAAKSTGAAQITINYSSMPSGKFIRARAWMIDGTTTKSVTSAPVCIYPNGYSTDLKSFYYSIPESHSLATSPTISVNGITASVGNVAANPRFVEVIQNTREVKNMFNHSPYNCTYPLDLSNVKRGKSINWDLPNSSYKKAGFYIARVIDNNENVSFSDPVLVDFPTDISYVRIKNHNKPTFYMYDKGNQLGYGTIAETDYSSHWSMESVDGYTAFKNRATGDYMNIETLQPYAECTGVPTTFFSAQWSIEDVLGYKRIRNRWKNTDYLHIENLLGYVEHGPDPVGFWGGEWSFETTLKSANIIASGISEPFSETIDVYPNPVGLNNQLNIRLTSDQTSRVIIYDLQGRTVYTKTFRSQLVFCPSAIFLIPGFYLIKVVSGEDVKDFKLVVN